MTDDLRNEERGLTDHQEMTAHDETFKKIEAYDDMTIQALQYSKIGKGKANHGTWAFGRNADKTRSDEEDLDARGHPTGRRAQDPRASGQAHERCQYSVKPWKPIAETLQWHAFIEKEQAAGSQTNGDKE